MKRARVACSILLLLAGMVSPAAALAGGPPPPPPPPPPPAPEAPHPFTDIDSSGFQVEIAWLYNSGITGGCTSTTFCPTSNVTREQMASFLARGVGLPSTSTDYFTDDEASWHEADINRIAKAGITTGCAAQRFCPTRLVTREQMASFLVRALGLPATTTDYFTDDESSPHEPHINALRGSGITTGCTLTKFCPGAGVTREQMAAFLFRGLVEYETGSSATATDTAAATGPSLGAMESIEGVGIDPYPTPPYTQLTCATGAVYTSSPTVNAEKPARDQAPTYVSFIEGIYSWNGASWVHLGWSNWYYDYVYGSDFDPGSPIGQAGGTWYAYNGGPAISQGLRWNVTSGWYYAVVGWVVDSSGSWKHAWSATGATTGTTYCAA